MTILTRGLAAARGLLVLAALGFCAAASAQGTASVSGTFGGPTFFGGSVHGSFKCTGAPVCVGTYTAQVQNGGCSNAVTIGDLFQINGINVTSQPGPVSGTATLKNALYDDSGPQANGICTVVSGSYEDLTVQYTGHWDGSRGSFTVTEFPVAGTYTAEVAAPIFPMTVRANIDSVRASATADIQYRPQDVGTIRSVFVFALAPATRVQGATSPGALKVGFARDEKKADTPIACVLAQLNASGQMVAVTSANLAAYLTEVLVAQGNSVTILNGVPTGNVTGATFFVGYGSSGTAMINTGVNRAAVTIPGSLTCAPTAPQTGWWWNPLEDGRGFSLEKRGNNLFFAAFLYDISGRSTWYVSSGPVSLEGSLYNGDLLSAAGGQTLGGPYVRFPALASVGSMTLTFNNESTGTLVWPGGTVPIQRFNIIANGVNAPPVAGVPQSGWWWNEQESGRGFFMEWQGPTLDIAGYMYDDNGNSVWYLTVGDLGGTPSARTFNGTWWSYTGGQTLTGAWRQNTRSNSNVAPMAITFSGPETALMTLPNGRTTTLRRHRF